LEIEVETKKGLEPVEAKDLSKDIKNNIITLDLKFRDPTKISKRT